MHESGDYMQDSTDLLRSALLAHAQPGLRPRDVLSAIRRQLPSVPRDEMVRAAFHAMIEVVDSDPDKASALQEFALSERGGIDWTEGSDASG